MSAGPSHPFAAAPGATGGSTPDLAVAREELSFVGPRDRAITLALREQFAHDDRLRQARISPRCSGGVVHLTGLVPSEAEREAARRVASRGRGVHAVWDLMDTVGQRPLVVVDIGCGPTKQHARAHGFDGRRIPGVDVVLDLEGPLPIADRSVDRLFAVHVLEHIRNLVPLMNEIHRVLKPGGVLHAMTPNWRFVNAVADPTHVRFFDVQTFKHFCRPSAGVRPFRPLMASASVDNVYADLIPLEDAEEPPGPAELGEWFD